MVDLINDDEYRNSEKMNVSVCIATYNGEKYIVRQLRSILCQLSSFDEVVIVDDCSSDATCRLIDEIDDDRVCLRRNKQNLGFVKSFEQAILHAKNDIIFLSDQDDEWFEQKVAKIKPLFEEKTLDLVIHNAAVVDGEGNVILEKWHRKSLGHHLFTRHFINNHNMGCMMAFRREFSDIAYPFPDCVESHDQWIGLNIDLQKKKIHFLDECLMIWIRHGLNASSMRPRSVKKIIVSRIKMCSLVAIFYWRRLKRTLLERK